MTLATNNLVGLEKLPGGSGNWGPDIGEGPFMATDRNGIVKTWMCEGTKFQGAHSRWGVNSRRLASIAHAALGKIDCCQLLFRAPGVDPLGSNCFSPTSSYLSDPIPDINPFGCATLVCPPHHGN
jgi:hypothetical protein